LNQENINDSYNLPTIYQPINLPVF